MTQEAERPLRIAFATTWFDTIHQGPAKFAHLILGLNDRSDTELELFTEDITLDRPSVTLVKVQQSKWLKPLNLQLRQRAYANAIRQAHLKQPFDIVIYNNAVIAHTTSLRWDVPIVGMINDDNNATAVVDLSMQKLSLKHLYYRWYEKQVFHNLALVITNSAYLSNLLEQRYGKNKQKVVRLYKSIQLRHIQLPSRPKLDSKQVSILFIKHDFERGGLTDLLEAVSLLPQYNISITAAGFSREAFMKLSPARSPDSYTKLKCVGVLSQEEVFRAMQQHDIFCVPSHKEALGVANIEALHEGIPVVSTEVGGIPEVLDNGRNGWLCRANDPSHLSEAIKSCIEQNDLREKKRKSGFQFVSKNFHSTNMLNSLRKILAECVST